MKSKIARYVALILSSAMLLTSCSAKKKDPYTPVLPTASEEAGVYVKPVSGLSSDFIKGMDISSLISEEDSGVKYYDENGEEQDLFRILADNGINYIRVRVWNNPYDADGNGYGGGNCDVEKAAELGKRAADYGMRLLVDFHYSDFWADPNKQYTPVEWRRQDIDTKAQLLYDFTVDALEEIIDEGADVGMVQIGNEINNGLSGEYDTANIMRLLSTASEAVRSVDPDIKIAVHYTGIDAFDDTMLRAQTLQDYDIDYDIFGVSYYPYWHGTMDNMENVLRSISSTYGKDTCVLETSYMYTGDDGDCFGNSLAGEDAIEGYPASVDGQAKCIRDIIQHASDAGSLGVFYWEGAWIPVGNEYESNYALWEENGSGWASSFSVSYDSQDAGKYFGGCSWDNQAFFDNEGHVLPSLGVFKYVDYGATAPLRIMAYGEVSVEVQIGNDLVLPETIPAYYNDPDVTDGVPVTWDAADIDTSVAGTYEITGTTSDGTSIAGTVKVANINYISNPSFEDVDMTMWEVNDYGDGHSTDRLTKSGDAHSGDNSFHFWSESPISFTVSQSFTDLAAGPYAATCQIQGGDVGDGAVIYVYITVNGTEYASDPVELTGWVNWQTALVTGVEINEGDDVTVGVHVEAAGGGWGTIDDVEFYSELA